MKLLLVLWLLFLERMGYEEAVYVTVGEIIDKCRLYDIELTPVEFKKAYATFRRFCLIDYSDDITKEDGAVRLYPSLQFCLDIGQLRQVMAEFVEQEDFEAADMADLEEAEVRRAMSKIVLRNVQLINWYGFTNTVVPVAENLT